MKTFAFIIAGLALVFSASATGVYSLNQLPQLALDFSQFQTPQTNPIAGVYRFTNSAGGGQSFSISNGIASFNQTNVSFGNVTISNLIGSPVAGSANSIFLSSSSGGDSILTFLDYNTAGGFYSFGSGVLSIGERQTGETIALDMDGHITWGENSGHGRLARPDRRRAGRFKCCHRPAWEVYWQRLWRDEHLFNIRNRFHKHRAASQQHNAGWLAGGRRNQRRDLQNSTLPMKSFLRKSKASRSTIAKIEKYIRLGPRASRRERISDQRRAFKRSICECQ